MTSISRGQVCRAVGRLFLTSQVRTAGTSSEAAARPRTTPIAINVPGLGLKRGASLVPEAIVRMSSRAMVTTNWETWTSATVATASEVVTPRRVSIRRLSAAGPIPAGAASATNAPTAWTRVTRHTPSLTGENATSVRAAPRNVTRPSANATTLQRQSLVASAEVIWLTLTVVITTITAAMGRTTVSTLRAPNRTSRSGSTSASGRCLTSAERSSGSTSGRARISSRVRRGRAKVCSSGPIAAMSSAGRTAVADSSARSGPTRTASSATIWVRSIRRASSDDATSPDSHPVSHTIGPTTRCSTSTVSEVRARWAIPASCARRSWSQIPRSSSSVTRSAGTSRSGTASPGRPWMSSIESLASATASSGGVRTPAAPAAYSSSAARSAAWRSDTNERPSMPRRRSDRHSRESAPITCRSPSSATTLRCSPLVVVSS